MNEIRFENAFGDVPPAVHARVAAALRDVKTVKRAKPAAAILLAALLALALAGAAYAAVRSGVLAFLFTGGEPTESQEAMVQAVGLERTGGGVTTT
nr:hypothetical protein [Ottowia sp.]